MKKEKTIHPVQVPVRKLQRYFTELASVLAKNASTYSVSRQGNSTSIEIAPGEYVTITIQKGGSYVQA